MATTGGPTTYPPSESRQQQQQQQQNRRLFQQLDWNRPDGRTFHQCRPAFLRTGAANAASGSAYAEFGATKVIVSVFGPRESKKAMMYSDIGRLNCNVSYTTFSTPTRGQGSDHKEFSSMLHKALEGAIILESFPKTTVDVFALVLESGGGDLPVIISCASLALADAGIMIHRPHSRRGGLPRWKLHDHLHAISSRSHSTYTDRRMVSGENQRGNGPLPRGMLEAC